MKTRFLEKINKLKPERVLGFFVGGLAVLLLVWLFTRAITTVDLGYDALWYHYPFAARLGGVFDPAVYQFSPYIESIYQGFPKFGNLLQGLLWSFTGLMTAVNLLNFFSLVALIYSSYRYLKVPFWLSTVMLLSIPLVLIHSVTAYMDLFPAAMLTIATIILINTAQTENYSRKRLIIILVVVAFGMMAKFQVYIFGFFIFLTTFTLYFRFYFDGKTNLYRNTAILVAITIVIGLISISQGIHNYLQFDNFIHPVTITEEADKASARRAEGMEQYPQYVIYLISLSEFNLYNSNDGLIYTADQGQASGEASPAFRMGGYFFGNLALWSLVLVFASFVTKSRKPIYALGLLWTALLAIGLLPTGYILRYWLYLPLVFAVVAGFFLMKIKAKNPQIFWFILAVQLIFLLFVLRHSAHAIIPRPNQLDITSYNLQLQSNAEIGEAVCVQRTDILDHKLVATPEGEALAKPHYRIRTILYRVANPEVDIYDALQEETICNVDM